MLVVEDDVVEPLASLRGLVASGLRKQTGQRVAVREVGTLRSQHLEVN